MTCTSLRHASSTQRAGPPPPTGTHEQRADTNRHRARALRPTLLALATLTATLAATANPSAARTVRFSWQPSAQRFWHVNGPSVVSLFHNGQCTMWAQQRRPDIVRRGVEAIVAREITAGKPEDMGNWNARFWPAHARLAGIRTGHRARAHALIVFQPRVLDAGPLGHVAYIQRVYPDGSFLISEMHAPVLWQVTHRRLTAADSRLTGVTFIY